MDSAFEHSRLASYVSTSYARFLRMLTIERAGIVGNALRWDMVGHITSRQSPTASTGKIEPLHCVWLALGHYFRQGFYAELQLQICISSANGEDVIGLRAEASDDDLISFAWQTRLNHADFSL